MSTPKVDLEDQEFAALAGDPEFTAEGNDRYRFDIPHLAISFTVDRLRRERNELVGELSAECRQDGAGSLPTGDLNFSSVRARQDRAKLFGQRARVKDLDWFDLIDQLVRRVHDAERRGEPAVDLRKVERPSADELRMAGFALPRRHSSIAFGDGGGGKSYIGLFFGGQMSRAGLRVALFDWELAGEDHRDRLERIYGPDEMPLILYARCERPLVHEADRLRRIVREKAIDYAIYDSIAFACDGPPEAAETAGKYFRAVRSIGCGSLHIAHVNRSDHSDQKPFGSTFWHNGARSTWFIQAAERAGEDGVLRLGLFNRKSNLGPLRPPVGFNLRFTKDRTLFETAQLEDTPDLAGTLAVWMRMRHALRQGALSPEQIAEEIDAEPETVKREARRRKRVFVVLDGGRRIGLAAPGQAPDKSGQGGVSD